VTRERLIRGGRELAILLVLYGAYSLVRNLMGDNEAVAFVNAERIISAEKSLFIFHEAAIQDALDYRWIMQPLNSFYGIAHFIVTAGLMIWLYHRRASYSRYRNAILVTTLVALIGYLTFPLAPPRMLPEYGFFDALELYGSPWTYENSAVGSISNQFAAMPSLHIGWALWCSWVIWKEGAFRWLRPVAVLYSTLVLLTIVATGNHYFLDAVGGLVVLLIGIAVTHPFHKRRPVRPHQVEDAARDAILTTVASDDIRARTPDDVPDVPDVVAARQRDGVPDEGADVLG